jgi:hypothetical protein
MPNLLVAGNSTNGGTAISTDTSGTLNIVTGSGSGANAITIDASQNVTFANAISVAGNATITGTLTATGGVTGSITSGTSVTASGTSVTFTGIPSGVKRITVMFSGISTNGSSNILIQIGSGSFTTSGYIGTSQLTTSAANASVAFTTGFGLVNAGAAYVSAGLLTIDQISTNAFVSSGNFMCNQPGVISTAGQVSLGGTLDRVRLTTVNGTDTFDAGSINILYE